MDTPLASSTPPPLVPARGPESSWNPDFLLQQPENLDFARPASVARSGEPAVEATRDPIVVATLDRFARRSGAAPQADGARDARAYATLPTRNSPVDADAAFHLAEIAKHIDRLRHTGVIDGDGTAPRTGTPGANSLRIATPADESLASNRPVSRASRTSNAVGEGSPDTAIPMEPLQDEAVANEPVSASADALPKTPAKGDHDINAGKVLENIILRVGINKSNIPWDKTLFLAILAGFFTFAGAAFAISTGGGIPATIRADWPGLPKLIIGATFPVGIFFIVLFGGELFTGNTMILLVAFFNRKVSFGAVLINWILVYLGNMASCFFCAYFFGYQTHIFGNPAYQAFLADTANLKCSLPWHVIFIRAIPANALVCLSIFLGLAARDVTGKILGMWIPIFTFAAIGFEHCVANMTFITLALYYQPPGLTATWAGFWFNQSAALLGNIIGGGLLIGGSEYWMYHWRSWSEPSRHMGRWGRVQPVIPPPDSEEMEKGKLDDEGLAELDPGMAQFSRVPTLLSTSDPVLSYSGAGGKGRSVAPEAIRTDSMIYVSPGAYRRQTGLQGAVSFAGEPYLVPGTFSGMQSRPVVIVESPPVSAPVSPIVPVARRSSGQIKAL